MSDEREREARWSRVLHLPLIRILLAGLFIVPPIAALQVAADALSVDWRAVAPFLLLILLVTYAAYVRVVEKRRTIHELETRGAAAQSAAGFFLGASLFGATMLVLWLLGGATAGPGEGWAALLSGLVGALVAAFSEELLFRGVVFRILSEWLGDVAALAISAALFGLLHAGNPGATLLSSIAIALEAGVLLAAAFMITRQLWLPIGLHAGWNFTEGGVFGASVSGSEAHGLLSSRFEGDPLLSGGDFGPEASIVAVIICLAASALFLAVARRRRASATTSAR